MPRINLKLFATLSSYSSDDNECIQVQDGTDIGQLLRDFGIPPDRVALIFVNGVRKDTGYCLKDGDRIGLFPPVGGG
jgi:molybdopterin converting factor small subunit